MEPFLRHAGREFYAITLARPSRIVPPFAPAPYPCLIWDTCGGWSERERTALIDSLLDSGVRYTVCGGIGCERWHDEIDARFLERYPDDERGQAQHFVMTTWHTDEPPAEVAFFFAYNTNSDVDDFKHFLVVYLGSDPAVEARLQGAVTAALEDYDRFERDYPEAAG